MQLRREIRKASVVRKHWDEIQREEVSPGDGRSPRPRKQLSDSGPKGWQEARVAE